MGDFMEKWPLGVAWFVAGFLALVTIFQHTWLGDEWRWVVVAVLYTPILFLPAWAVAGFALSRKDYPLSVVALIAVLGHIWALWPVLPLNDSPDVPDGPALRVGSANLIFDNRDKLAAVGRVLEQPLDVLAVTEYTEEYRGIFDRQGVAIRYPFRYESAARYGPTGIAVFSRFPLQEVQPLTFGNHAVQAVVTVGGIRVTVLAVHTEPPWEENIEGWRDSMDDIGRQARAQPDPVVVAGNLNATPYNHAFRQLVDGPLDDAAESLGSAWRLATWRNDTKLFPTSMIDHVVTSPGAVPSGMKTVSVPGSDHRMVVVDLRLGPP
jgi:endonuclease/exonuclease/phosphatase (EEP) superfamily protein YafD